MLTVHRIRYSSSPASRITSYLLSETAVICLSPAPFIGMLIRQGPVRSNCASTLQMTAVAEDGIYSSGILLTIANPRSIMRCTTSSEDHPASWRECSTSCPVSTVSEHGAVRAGDHIERGDVDDSNELHLLPAIRRLHLTDMRSSGRTASRQPGHRSSEADDAGPQYSRTPAR